MTLLRRSSREPDSWSAAVRRNRSVFVAAGRITGAGSSTGFSIDSSSGGSAGSVELVGSDMKVSSFKGGFENEVEDIRDGATVVGGGVKNEPSSKVSRKSLFVRGDKMSPCDRSNVNAYVRTENSLPSVSGW